MLGSFEEVNKVLAGFVPPANLMHSNYSLERIEELMERLGNPQDTFKVVHVAGTSGKTSTCYYLAAFLKVAAQKVGLTVSPHITEVNERAQINLEPLREGEFCKELNEFLGILDKTGIEVTYFELLVAFAYWEFARKKVDYAVVEVGLGGLLDCTNVINRPDKTCVITDIGLDHISVLGDTLPEIAAQKAGIIKPGNVVFTLKQSPEISRVFQETAKHQRANLHELQLPDEPVLPDTLTRFQQRNWYLASRVYQHLQACDKGLPVLNENELLGIAKTHIPARMEVLHLGDRILVLDGAHNPQKMQALAESIKDMFPDQKVACLFGLIKSMDYRIIGTLGKLVDITDHLIITSFKTEQDLKRRSVDPAKVARLGSKLGLSSEVIDNPGEALAHLLARPEPVLLITGSFFLIQYIRPLILKKQGR